MSGIAGILRPDGAPVSHGLVQQMIAALGRRGPDAHAFWEGDCAALGQCMLHTTPESLEERQPLVNEGGNLVLVMDGRVDNWEELRAELLRSGAVLPTRADAELVLRAYETWGAGCVSRIDGDFAFVVWDSIARTAFCARDRIGHKPLHYHWDGRTFTFASEPQAILAMPWVKAVPNEGVLAEFLAGEWHSRDETLWAGVLRLVPAHRMTVGVRGPAPQRYWEPDLWATLPFTRDEEYVEHYRDLLTESVRRMSRSHRPIASHVSGGLDSSAVFCVAHHLQQAGRLPAPGLQGRTLAFPGHRDADELGYARALGRHLGVSIVEDAPTRLLPHQWYVGWAEAGRSYPGAPNSTMLMGMIRDFAAQGGKVILTGIGGDEWLWTAHHAYYDEELAQRNWGNLWRAARADGRAFGRGKAAYWLVRHGIFARLPAVLKDSLRALKKQAHGLRGGAADPHCWLAPGVKKLIEQRREQFAAEPTPVRTAGQRYLLYRLYGAVYGDVFREHDERMCSELGVEERNPMFSAKFVQFAFSTPDRLRRKGAVNKWLHVRAMQGLMPREILKRRDKADFSVVTYDHIDRWKPDFAIDLARSHPEQLSQEGVAALWEAYESGRDKGGASWNLWCLYAWKILSNQMQHNR